MKQWLVAMVALGTLRLGGEVATAAANPTPARAEATAQQVLDGRYQRAATGVAPAPSETPWANAPGDGARQPRRASGGNGGGGGGGLGAILWVVLAVLVIVAIVAVVLSPTAAVRHLPTVAQAAPPPAASPVIAQALPTAPLQRPLATAEQLAAAGRFAEAIHALLGQTLAELGGAANAANPANPANRAIKPSDTSRDIVRQVALPPAPRQALVGLIHAVERTRFAGDLPTAEDYAACRAQFERFANTYHASAPQGGRA